MDNFFKFNFNFFFFFHRFARLKAKDNDFKFHFSNLGNLRDKGTEFNWDNNIDNSLN